MKNRGTLIIVIVAVILVLYLLSKKAAAAASTVPSITGAGGNPATNPFIAFTNGLSSLASHMPGLFSGATTPVPGSVGSSINSPSVPGYIAPSSSYDPNTDSSVPSMIDPLTGQPYQIGVGSLSDVGNGLDMLPAGSDTSIGDNSFDPFGDDSSGLYDSEGNFLG